LVRKVLSVQLYDRKDVFTWLLNKGIFPASSMYKDLMKETNSYGHGVVWKLKLPLKIKVFLWYLRRGVILTKDNLGKRNWKGCTRCCFCSSEESIQHLFFECQVAKLMWNTLFFAFGIYPPSCVDDLFGSWRRSFPPKFQKAILIGASAFCWAIWISRNDVIFKNSITNSPLQVIFRGTFWIRCWSILSKEEERTILKESSQQLEITAMEILNKFGWKFRNRIEG